MKQAKVDIIRDKGKSDATKLQLTDDIRQQVVVEFYGPLVDILGRITWEPTISNIIYTEINWTES